MIKDPQEVLDYAVDWDRVELRPGTPGPSGSGWLAPDEIVISSEWAVPSGLTQASPAPSHTDTTATIWLSGGTPGIDYRVTNHITTSDGRQGERSIPIEVREK